MSVSKSSNESGKDEPVIYDYDPRKLPTEYLRAIGLVVAASAQTEHILKQFIGALLNIDNIQTLALTTHMTIPLKDHIIRALAELNAPSIAELDKIDDLLDAIKNAFDIRNTIVHNTFATHPDTKKILSHRLNARGSLRLELKPITVKEIEQNAAMVYKAGMDIVQFMISRGLEPIERTKPIRQPINRKKKAREERRNNLA